MIITDLSYLTIIRDREKIIGGRRIHYNKALALARSSAYGPKSSAVSGTSIYVDRGIAVAQSFSVAETTSEP